MAITGTIIYEIKTRYERMKARGIGRSKHKAKRRNHGKPPRNAIFSYATFLTYLHSACQFGRWVQRVHHCHRLVDARRYVPEYLRMRIDQKLSAWTIHKDASALAKLYQCSYLDFGVKLPRRERKNRVKNRTNPLANDPEYEALVHYICEFCAATGLRRHELLALRGDDIILDKSENPVILVRQGKGGKRRYVHPLNSFPFQLFLNALNNGTRQRKLFNDIPSRIPTHFFRGEYARALYYRYARPLDQIPPEDQYRCRKDMKGIVLDKKAMHKVSKELGHNRISVVTLYLS